MGHQALEAADGRQALAILEETPGIDAVLLDLHMGPMDGLSMLETLRAHPQTRDLPVICVSANAGFEEQAKAREAGADGYVVKPFRRRKLIAAIDAVLRKTGRLRPEQSIEPS